MNLQSKICLVTGANSGIGKAAALGLAKTGAVVALLCRDENRGRTAQEQIKAESGNNSIELFTADLSSQASIRRFSGEFHKKHDRLHVLVNNAGTFSSARHVTVDGLEQTFAVNYLARFLLVSLLLDLLKNGAPSRIIDVSGAYHAKGRLDFDNLQLEKGYGGARANNQTKLANVLFTYQLAKKLEGDRITVNTLHPGTVATDLIMKDPGTSAFMKLLYRFFKRFMKTPEQGAATIVYLATSPEVEGITGKYFVNKRAVPSSGLSNDRELGAKLWQTSEAILNEKL